MPNTYILTTRDRKISVPTIAAASAAYCADRDASGEGGSTWPQGVLTGPDGERLFVSYNGRVWANDPRAIRGVSHERPVFCPIAA